MNKWIAVVDDDAITRWMAQRTFRDAGIEAKVFSSGREALEQMGGENVPALILLDIYMPEMDGFEVLDALRARKAYQKVPVIFLTGDNDPQTEQRGYDAGAVDFVTKPIVADDLLRRVREAIGQHRA